MQQTYSYYLTQSIFFKELELGGKLYSQLQWLRYNVINMYKNGQQNSSEIDVSSAINYPPLHFSRVQIYTYQADEPLR